MVEEQKTKKVSTLELQAKYSTGVAKQLEDLQNNQGLKMPKDYNASAALQGALFALTNISGRNALDPSNFNSLSVRNSLMDMLTQGLSVGKKQGYFIPYAKDISFMRSYFGTQTVLKRLPDIKDIYAIVVHAKDELELGYDEQGNTKVIKHNPPKITSKSAEEVTAFLDAPIVGAYATIVYEDGHTVQDFMTIKRIKQSWGMSRNHSVQEKFPDEMAKRTVIQHAAKNLVNSSTDDEALWSAYNRNTDEEFDDNKKDVTPDDDGQKVYDSIVSDEEDDEEPEKNIDIESEGKPEETDVKENENADD